MKTIQLSDDQLAAVRQAVEANLDFQQDTVFDEVPTTVREIRSLSAMTDEALKARLDEDTKTTDMKISLIIDLQMALRQLS